MTYTKEEQLELLKGILARKQDEYETLKRHKELENKRLMLFFKHQSLSPEESKEWTELCQKIQDNHYEEMNFYYKDYDKEISDLMWDIMELENEK